MKELLEKETWLVRRTQLPLINHHCAVCSASRAAATGKFRVNANGKLIDVWLLASCAKCSRTAKVPIIERSPVRRIKPELLQRFTNNDVELVAQVLLDLGNKRRNQSFLDWTASWTLIRAEGERPTRGPLSVSVEFTDLVQVRVVHVIAAGLGLSNTRVKQLIQRHEIQSIRDLKGKTTGSFEFSIPFTENLKGPEACPRVLPPAFVNGGHRWKAVGCLLQCAP